MQHVVWVWLLAALFTFLAQPADLTGRLIFLRDGDFWSWHAGELTQHTTGGYRSNPALSPDGTKIAFNRVSPEAIEQSSGEVSYFDPPQDIWLWDLTTGTFYPVAVQLDGVSLRDGTFRMRSAPVWSPDGARIAWTEWDYTSVAIMVHDVARQTTEVFSEQVNMGFIDGSEYPNQTPAWGAHISKSVWSFMQGGDGGTLLYVYNADGEAISYQLDSLFFVDYEADERIIASDVRWVLYRDAWMLEIQYRSTPSPDASIAGAQSRDMPYRLMDADTGEQWQVDTYPLLQLRDAPPESVMVRWSTTSAEREIIWPDGSVTAHDGGLPAISPDGTQIVYFAWKDGAFQVITMQGGEVVDRMVEGANEYWDWVAWAPTVWRIPDDAALEPVAPFFPNPVRTLRSLSAADSYPLYTMYYAGAYTDPDDLEVLPAISEGSVQQPFGCSLFATYVDDEHMLFGRNFDWEYSPALLLFTDPPGGYASVSVVDLMYFFDQDIAGRLLELPLEDRAPLLATPVLPFDGMNEHGLAIGMAAVSGGQGPYDPDRETINSILIIRKVLDHARDVDEALALFEQYNISVSGGPPVHYLIADVSGRSVVVELDGNEVIVIPNEDDWQVMTNFLLNQVDDPDGHCARYDGLSEGLAEVDGEISTSDAMKLLKDVAQPSTQWSIVYDMHNGKVYVSMGSEAFTYHMHDFWLWYPEE